MSYFLRIFFLVLCVPVHFFLSLIPKNKNIWLFSAWGAAPRGGNLFIDNPKYIYKYVNSYDKAIDAIWVCSSHDLISELEKDGYHAIHRSSLKGVWYQLRAGVVVYTHAVRQEFNPVLVGRRVLKVLTWHGFPIKKIGFDDSYSKTDSILRDRYRRLFFGYLSDRPDLVLACGELDKGCYMTAFDVLESNIVITGYPRNDALYVGERSPSDDGDFRRVIYMPTLRGLHGSLFPLLVESDFDYHKFNELMIDNNAKMYVTTHPAQDLSQADIDLINGCSHIVVKATAYDIYQDLACNDVLITDYSGAYIDFLLLDKPVVMAAIDLDEYMSLDRELYYNYPDICPSDPCKDWSQVFYELERCLKGEFDKQRLARLKSNFHKYSDGFSSRRSYEAIKSYQKK